MKSSNQSIFKRTQTKYKSLPDIQQTAICGAVAAILVFSTVAFQYFYPDTSTTPTKPYFFKSQQAMKHENISKIKQDMDKHIIEQTGRIEKVISDIKAEYKDFDDNNFIASYNASKFRSLSMWHDTYSKELCESYNSVSFCAELKAEFASNINRIANSQIKAANSEREEALSKLEN